MSFLTGKLPDKATWWPVSGNDGYGGDTVSAPVLIDTRWEDRREKFFGALDKRELVSNAVVMMETDISVGDYLCKGDQTGQANPATVAGSYKVQRFDKIPDLRSLDSVRRAVL